MRRYGIFAVVTAAVMLILTTWLAPKTLSWWFQPPIPVPISCNDAVIWGTSKLVEAQLYSLLIGLVGGAAIAFGTRKKTTAQATLPPGTAAAAPASPQVSADKK